MLYRSWAWLAATLPPRSRARASTLCSTIRTRPSDANAIGFLRVALAYEVLGDETKRGQYDEGEIADTQIFETRLALMICSKRLWAVGCTAVETRRR